MVGFISSFANFDVGDDELVVDFTFIVAWSNSKNK